jgi:hypothetical protein
MSYETKLIIGQKMATDDMPSMQKFNRKYGRHIIEIARLDLSSVDSKGTVGKLIAKSHEDAKASFEETKVPNAVYTGATRRRDGQDHEIYLKEDNYGDQIGEIPLQELYDALVVSYEESKVNYSGDTGYRRFSIAIALIGEILATFKDSDYLKLVAYTYGH